MGYFYMAGFETQKWPKPLPGRAVHWHSPSRVSDKPDSVLVTDRLEYRLGGSAGDSLISIPHHSGRAIFNDHVNVKDPHEFRDVGTNIGLLDGSVKYHKIQDLEPRQIRHPYKSFTFWYSYF
jgi:hypothetical protein